MKTQDNQHPYTNSLIDESSPYLLQHAHNPVNWNPWNEEVLARAKRENKLLIISIGYSACHWCHVMEHESFEDSLVAKIMNDHFIPIKVDREERPDVDDVYMTACNLVTGRGGWPLNAFALPDGRPIWAGTYFPKDDWINILEQFNKLQQENPEKLEESADQITKGIKAQDQITVATGEQEFTSQELQLIGQAFIGQIDFVDGGRKGAPKFPMPNNYQFLLKYHYLYKDAEALRAVNITLDKMANGGIYDQIGGGYARYSVDGFWMVPHFEKMLYDNGQLVELHAEAYKLTQKPIHKVKIKQTLEFIERELMSDEFGFYSSLDADSEGEEGKFYVWDAAEIDSIIGDPVKSKIFKAYYDVKKNGNWEHTNILMVSEKIPSILEEFGIDQAALTNIISEESLKLMKHRETRVRPGLDDKILCSWNALMLSGYIKAYEALSDPHYLDIALKNIDFIEQNFRKSDHRLDRNYKEGKSTINAFLDDYALLIKAYTDLYQATFNESWLTKASELTDYVHDHFYNQEIKMYNYTSDTDPALVARKAEFGDNVIPGSNSVMARNLFTLGSLLYNEDYLDRSEQMLANMKTQITGTNQPSFFSNWCQLYLDNVQAPYEVAIVGPGAESKRSELSRNYLGNAIILGGQSEGSLALLKNKLQEDRTMIYVCQNKACKFPVEDVAKALELMK